jgi:hypothetical protein
MHPSTPPPVCRSGLPTIASNCFCTPPPPANSPDLAPADLFLFWKVKEELASLSLDENSFKKTWGGIVRTITADEFATTVILVLQEMYSNRRWIHRKKPLKINSF